MIIKSEYNIGDTVFYWSDKERKILRGVIDAISFFYHNNGEISWKYYIKEYSQKDKLIMSEPVSEGLIFKDKDEVLTFAAEITQILF